MNCKERPKEARKTSKENLINLSLWLVFIALVAIFVLVLTTVANILLRPSLGHTLRLNEDRPIGMSSRFVLYLLLLRKSCTMCLLPWYIDNIYTPFPVIAKKE